LAVMAVLLLTACDFLDEDSCYDIDHLWDEKNKTCSDSCVRQGGIFEVKEKHCTLSPDSKLETSEKELMNDVNSACEIIQNLVEREFKLGSISHSDHVNALQYAYTSLAPIGYTNTHNYGQDGVCNYRSEDSAFIKVYIRKNARKSSKYASGDFDVLRIERRTGADNEAEILWDRD